MGDGIEFARKNSKKERRDGCKTATEIAEGGGGGWEIINPTSFGTI